MPESISIKIPESARIPTSDGQSAWHMPLWYLPSELPAVSRKPAVFRQKWRKFMYVFSNLFQYILLHDSSHCKNGTVSGITYFDSSTWRAGMNNFSVANINSDMPRITDQVSRLGIGIADSRTAASLFGRGSRQSDSKMFVYTIHKSGTICSIGQTGSSINIWIPYKLSP